MRRHATTALICMSAVTCVAVAAAAVFWWLGAYHRWGLEGAAARVVIVDGRAELRVEGPDHPPWARSHLIVAEYDYDQYIITIGRYNGWNFFGPPLYREWPLIIRDRLVFDGEYLVRYWDGADYVELGRVTMEKGQLSFVAREDPNN